ncbi:trehalose-phosphatase [Candidatus Microgenomates bacterium]|nr:MAG: trehalose-phosphatase [Candidatus Microgenomates bacterium]
MKYLLDELKEVEIISNEKKIGLFLDFDGTLASFNESPEDVFLPLKTKQILLHLKEKLGFYLAIISGRGLEDLKNKVNIPDITYSGNHGLEWEIDGKKQERFIKKRKLRMLSNLKKQIQKLKINFKGVHVEDKKITLSIHYRSIAQEQLEIFKKQLEKIIKPYIQSGKLIVVRGKKVYSIRPKAGWNKGHVSKLLIDQLSKEQSSKLLPIYIGDDTTDEDAFLRLKEGITVKVGKSSQSCAKYYVEDIVEVVKVLEWLNNKKVIQA